MKGKAERATVESFNGKDQEAALEKGGVLCPEKLGEASGLGRWCAIPVMLLSLQGFQVLVESDWLDFGHKYGDRCGHQEKAEDQNEQCPVFLQWLDSVHQLLQQFPCLFEFNEAFLVRAKRSIWAEAKEIPHLLSTGCFVLVGKCGWHVLAPLEGRVLFLASIMLQLLLIWLLERSSTFTLLAISAWCILVLFIEQNKDFLDT